MHPDAQCKYCLNHGALYQIKTETRDTRVRLCDPHYDTFIAGLRSQYKVFSVSKVGEENDKPA